MATINRTEARPPTSFTAAVAILLVLATGCARSGLTNDDIADSQPTTTTTTKTQSGSPAGDMPSELDMPPPPGTPSDASGDPGLSSPTGPGSRPKLAGPLSGPSGSAVGPNPTATGSMPAPPGAPGAPPTMTTNPQAPTQPPAPSGRAPSPPAEGPNQPNTPPTTTPTPPSTTTTTATVDQAPIAQCAHLTLTVAGVFETYDYWLSKDCFSDPAGETIKVFSTQGNFGSVSAPSNQYCGSLAGNAWCWQYQPQSWDGTGYWDSFNIWAEDAAGNQSAPIRIDLCVNC